MVLKMLQEGRIGAEEAEELLRALDRAQGPRRQEDDRGDDRASEQPELDFGQIGRGIRDAMKGLTEGLRKLSETVPWGRDLGEWFRAALGGSKASVDRDVAVPSGTTVERVLIKGEAGAVSVRGSQEAGAAGKAHITAWGPDEAAAQRLAEGVRVFTQVRDGVLEITAGAPEGGSHQPGERAPAERYEVALEMQIPAAAALEVTTTSGSVATADLDGEAILHTASGRVSLTGLRGPTTVATASGDISGEHAGANRLEVKSSSGDVKLSLAPAPGAFVRITTSSGDVVIRLAPDVRARVEATTVSGEVSVRAPLRVEEAGRTRFVGVQGGSDSTVSLTSSSGDLRIEAPGA